MGGDKRQRSGGGGGGTTDRQAKRRRYAAAAKQSKSRTGAGEIRGPGLWLSCVRKKEAITTSEAYDLLNDVADRLYPETSKQATEGSSKDLEQQDSAGDVEEDDIEAQIAKELEDLQPAVDPETGKKKMRFQSARTDTECLIWICVAPPLDPIKLTHAIADDLQAGGPIRTRFLQRITPVSNTTHADPNSLKRLAYRILQPLIAPSDYTREQREADEPIKYRIEPTLRNHTASLNRQVVTDVIGEVVRDLANAHFQFPKRQVVEHVAEPTEKSEGTTPGQAAEPASADATQASSTTDEETEETSNMPAPGQVPEEIEVKPQGDEAPVEETPWNILPPYRRRIHVDLKHPTHTILVSALRGVCGISVVEGYDEKKKFNVQMLGGNTDMNGRDKPRSKAMEQTTEDAAMPSREDADAPASSAKIGPEAAEPEAGTSKAESSDQTGDSNENPSNIETVQAVASDGQANVGETLSAP